MNRIILTIAFLFITSAQVCPQWFWQNPLPYGNAIYDIQFTDSATGYLCGVQGMMIKTTNSGSNWKILETPTDKIILDMHFIDNKVGWFITYGDRNLYKTTDGGLTWNSVTSFSPMYVYSIYFLDEQKGFAGGHYSLLITTDGGYTWIENTSVSGPHAFYFIDHNVGYAGSVNKIFKTTDGGSSWISKAIPTYNFNPSKIFAYDQNNIYAVGNSYWITGDPIPVYFHSSNGGNTWIGKNFENHVSDVYFVSPNVGWVSAGRIYKTTDRGISWDSTNFYAHHLEFINNYSWGATVNTLSFSKDGWQTVTPQISSVFSGFIWNSDAKDTNIVFACGSNRTILGTTDGGISWSKYYSSVENKYLDAITLVNNKIYAVGQGGFVVYSSDNGQSWNEKIINGNWLSDITFISDSIGFIAGSLGEIGAIFVTVDGGNNWELSESFPESWTINNIKFSHQDLGWISAYQMGILRSTSSGRDWQLLISSNSFIRNIEVSGDTAWFSYDNKILRTTDAGNTWESFTIFNFVGVQFSGAQISFINSEIGFAGTYDNRIFKTTDAGETWFAESFPSGMNIHALSFVNENIGWAFGSSGAILKRDPNYTSINLAIPILPKSFLLEQNYPNPFNPGTKISWQSPVGGYQTLKVYDVLGNEIVTLVNEYRNAGSYEVEFNSAGLSSGVYFYRIQVGDFIETKKMVLIR